jgi:hypothetical protein
MGPAARNVRLLRKVTIKTPPATLRGNIYLPFLSLSLSPLWKGHYFSPLCHGYLNVGSYYSMFKLTRRGWWEGQSRSQICPIDIWNIYAIINNFFIFKCKLWPERLKFHVVTFFLRVNFRIACLVLLVSKVLFYQSHWFKYWLTVDKDETVVPRNIFT